MGWIGVARARQTAVDLAGTTSRRVKVKVEAKTDRPGPVSVCASVSYFNSYLQIGVTPCPFRWATPSVRSYVATITNLPLRRFRFVAAQSRPNCFIL